jgi:membrane fusion protein (multidrug efflux system)
LRRINAVLLPRWGSSSRFPVLAAALLLVSAPGCTRQEGSAGAAPAPAAGAPAPETEVEVRIEPVRRGTIVQRIDAPGTLEARRESRIGAEVTGRIDSVFVDEGDRVAEGAPLFQIDREPFEMALRQAQAALDHARAERRQVESDLARARELEKKQVVAAQQIEKLETGLAVAKSAEEEASQAVALAQHKLGRTLVRAPYAASVVARLVDEGTTALSMPQTIVVVLQESDELEARATIPESRLSFVQVGDPALIHIEGVPAPIQTEIYAVGDAIDPATRTYTVKMRVPNPEHALKAGLFATIEILPRSKRDALVVPRDAIRSEDGVTRVFTVREGRATPVPVTVGVVTEGEAEILEGLRVDMPVIVGDAARQLAPGMRVREAKRGGGDGA